MKRKPRAKKRDIVLGRQRLSRLRKFYLSKIPLEDGELSSDEKSIEDINLKEAISVGNRIRSKSEL